MNLSSEKLLATLKREKPAKLVAYLGDDKERTVSVKGGRKGMSQTVATVEALAWVRVELLDKGGALLATVENTDPAGELQELSGGGGVWGQVERGLSIVLKAQEHAMRNRGEELRTTMQAQTELMREMGAAMKQLTQLQQEQIATVRETASIQAEAAIAAAGGADEWSKIVEALPTLVQALPVIKGLLAGGVAPTNGVRKVT